MKKLILLITACIYSTLCFAQADLEGEWKFKSMKFYERDITFDSSEKDKEKVLLSWMELGGDDIEDVELKKHYTEQKQNIYNIAKGVLSSKIIFENFRVVNYGDYAYADFKSFEQAENEFEVILTTKKVEFENPKKGNILMEIVDSGHFNNYEHWKLILRGNALEIINLENEWEDEGVIKITYVRK